MLVITGMSGEKDQPQMFSNHLARVRNFEFENRKIGQFRPRVIQMKFRVHCLEVVDVYISLQRPDWMSAADCRHLRISDCDFSWTLTTQVAGSICHLGWVGDLHSDIVDFEIGSPSDGDRSTKFEIDALKSDVSLNAQRAVLPI